MIREEKNELLLVSELLTLKCLQILVLLIIDQLFDDILEGYYADHLELGVLVLHDFDLCHNGHVRLALLEECENGLKLGHVVNLNNVSYQHTLKLSNSDLLILLWVDKNQVSGQQDTNCALS